MVNIIYIVTYTDSTERKEVIPYNNMEEANEEIKIFLEDDNPFLDDKTVFSREVIRPL